ncbi:MAG: hypothetical protein M1833_001163 [Piccolia ochrophora]|nr:MAG: hypothetical protein M1833_001163 [Piccolia ochrophora]
MPELRSYTIDVRRRGRLAKTTDQRAAPRAIAIARGPWELVKGGANWRLGITIGAMMFDMAVDTDHLGLQKASRHQNIRVLARVDSIATADRKYFSINTEFLCCILFQSLTRKPSLFQRIAPYLPRIPNFSCLLSGNFITIQNRRDQNAASRAIAIVGGPRKLIKGGPNGRLGITLAAISFQLSADSDYLGLKASEMVNVNIDIRDGRHPCQYAKMSLPEDPAYGLGIKLTGNDSRGNDFTNWLTCKGPKAVMRANSLVDWYEDVDPAVTAATPGRWLAEI